MAWNDHIIYCGVFVAILQLIELIFLAVQFPNASVDDQLYPEAPGTSSVTSLIVAVVVLAIAMGFTIWATIDRKLVDNHMAGSAVSIVLMLFLVIWVIFQQQPRAIYMDTHAPTTIPPTTDDEKMDAAKLAVLVQRASGNASNRQSDVVIYATLLVITIGISAGLMYLRTPIIPLTPSQ